ncbi:unnamed protein product [Victoria cruziana]
MRCWTAFRNQMLILLFDCLS